MTNVAIIGAQWGDEGKGKVVDWLSERADVVVRFQGGHNAGHTLVVDGVTYKLSLLPSGVVRGKMSLIGNGVVLDPWALLAEIEKISAQGIKITPDNLKIAENTPLILPLHANLDKVREEAATGSSKIGTTGRGIGPAYEDKVGRRAVRICDLSDEQALNHKVDALLTHHNPLLRGLGFPTLNKDEILAQIKEIAPKIIPYAALVWQILDKAKKEGKKVLYEGAQGTLLDIDHGTYPYVTSSNTVAAQAATGSGQGPDSVGYVLGIAKAYVTRVGSGPFPTELFDAIGERIGERGREFGTVTGRKRRCGWFDAVLARQACKINGLTGVALTKLDVLDGIAELKICTGYMLDGQKIDHFPASMTAQPKLVPIYETMPGWTETTFGVRSLKDLPANAVKYIRRLEELMETPIALLSTSPEREDSILMQDPFA